ncbi:TPA: hypothetical protein QEM49_001369 [Pseudomonas putida]|uniref:hypothetical protein n=1 Tax=Pseudomonas putida TaxID=303 RepID=UPI0023646BB7|nr:hypothetical protein [Pseudomonas putida]MDD2010300.1 hypothetical protein [Pseudomonas putida]HDS1776886.1 hypothetical protein [Pseudomonas putida]
MITEVDLDNFKGIFEALVELFPSQPWLKTVRDIEARKKRTPHAAFVSEQENQLAYGLNACSDFLEKRRVQGTVEMVLSALSVASQIVHLCSPVATGVRGPKDLPARFRAGFHDPAGMRAVLFELQVALSLYQGGCHVEWLDESSGSETFDMLVTPPGLDAFELECKSFSADKGVGTTKHQAAKLYDILRPQLEGFLPIPVARVAVISVFLRQSIPTEQGALAILAGELAIAIKDGERITGNAAATLEYNEIILPYAWDGDATQVSLHAQQLYPIGATLATAWKDSQRGWVVLRAVVSGKENGFWKEIEKVAKKSIKNQLTGKRPGALALHFGSETIESLQSLSGLPDFNRAQKFAATLMVSDSCSHLAMLAIFSESSSIERSEDYLPSASHIYHFDSPLGLYPNLGLSRYFK